MLRKFDVLILGGGAAGLFCAAQVARRGRRVALLERSDELGKKILISGGGRCNFTNLHCAPENFLSNDPHFARSALARFQPADFIAQVEKHRIPYHEKKLGQLFCDRSAAEIVRMLELECREAGVELHTGVTVSNVRHSEVFVVSTRYADQSQSEWRAPCLIVATGGLSIPKMGATAFGYDLARQFGLNMIATRPGLVPLTFDPADLRQYHDLAGVSAEVIARCGRQQFQEKMLFTHRGLSGPAILQISSYWQPGQPLAIDLAPERDATAALRAAGTRTLAVLRKSYEEFLPNRLAQRWLELHAPENFTNASLEKLERHTHAWSLHPSGTEGYEKAEVTAGGVDTRELSSKTMEARKVPGLFFIGEVVDVTGQLGGFNFQWAWASAHAVASAF